jgi:TatD DNase family protein
VPVRYVDSHAHLDFDAFERDRDAVMSRARRAGLKWVVNPGAGLDASRRAVALARKTPWVRAAVGIHPHEASTARPDALAELEALAAAPEVVAVGEIGLDFYRNLSPRPVQFIALERQLEIAARVGKPVIIHDRDAHAEVMGVLTRWAPSFLRQEGRGVLHCYSGSVRQALDAVELGFYISFAGPLTSPNAKVPVEVARAVPLNRLLIETDCPYLTPHPYRRSERNEPANVLLVADALARARDAGTAEIAAATTANAERLFGLVNSAVREVEG